MIKEMNKNPKLKEEIVFDEFKGIHIQDLLKLMDKDDDNYIKEEFIYPFKLEQLEEDNI